MYQVTLSFSEQYSQKYKPILKQMSKDKRHSKIHICQQMGQNGNHKHYHVIVQLTDPDITVQGYRRRFISYFRAANFEPTPINLKIQTLQNQSDWDKQYNYLYKDPKDQSGKTLYNRGIDIKQWQTAAMQYALPKHKYTQLTWDDLIPKLKSLGWEYPQRYGKFLKILKEKHNFDISKYIWNQKKLAQWIAFHCSKDADHWDDMQITITNKLRLGL